jgi:hypothetical protein
MQVNELTTKDALDAQRLPVRVGHKGRMKEEKLKSRFSRQSWCGGLLARVN